MNRDNIMLSNAWMYEYEYEYVHVMYVSMYASRFVLCAELCLLIRFYYVTW